MAYNEDSSASGHDEPWIQCYEERAFNCFRRLAIYSLRPSSMFDPSSCILQNCCILFFWFVSGIGSVDWRGTKCFARSRDLTLRTGLTCMDWERASPTFPIAWISFWTELDLTIPTILIWHKVRAHSMDWYTHGISSPPTDWMRCTTR